jgi:16S rRNA processing protein RimM
LLNNNGNSTSDTCIGLITSPFGIKGEVKIKSFTDKVYFSVGNNLTLKNEKDIFIRKIISFREHQDNYLIRFDECLDRNSIEELIGCEVFTDAKVKRKNSEFLIRDLVGLECFVNGESFGFVNAFIDIPNGQLIEIKTNEKLIKIPFVSEFIDVEKNKIIIKPIPGLL